MTSGGVATQSGFAAEQRVADAFRRLGYVVHEQVMVGPLTVDLVLERHGTRTPVEVVGVSNTIKSDQLRQTIVRLSTLRGADIWTGTPIVVVAGDMSLATRNWARHQTDAFVYSLQELEAQAAAGLPPTPVAETPVEPPEAPSRQVAERNQARASLITELRNHDNGAAVLTPADFERLCMRVFTFLFDPDLFGFERQAETTDGGNRYDFICRIAPGRPFWDSLRADFRTKALLFECKNYSAPITADQIYSTERYLFAGALRTVCFLIARKGGDAGCMRAAQGAMRESGKLILVLSNLDLIEMLETGEDRDSAENVLDERIWRFIISLPR
ncbi:hypothetical protein [Caulobacter mirabilis]|uniref:Restriction endonuclease type IV Mrr domain-containing protein n=1 Tax=Caulobacter mirabilis TaxID=69666 RepID=A0A2D2AUK9_9CAUL|nr:hypothetical protein [Caulobacter mirabilis]ATQ41694.1 hypothetical protein CSW64_04335 [Caulobacter mirabilis]